MQFIKPIKKIIGSFQNSKVFFYYSTMNDTLAQRESQDYLYALSYFTKTFGYREFPEQLYAVVALRNDPSGYKRGNLEIMGPEKTNIEYAVQRLSGKGIIPVDETAHYCWGGDNEDGGTRAGDFWIAEAFAQFSMILVSESRC